MSAVITNCQSHLWFNMKKWFCCSQSELDEEDNVKSFLSQDHHKLVPTWLFQRDAQFFFQEHSQNTFMYTIINPWSVGSAFSSASWQRMSNWRHRLVERPVSVLRLDKVSISLASQGCSFIVTEEICACVGCDRSWAEIEGVDQRNVFRCMVDPKKSNTLHIAQNFCVWFPRIKPAEPEAFLFWEEGTRTLFVGTFLHASWWLSHSSVARPDRRRRSAAASPTPAGPDSPALTSSASVDCKTNLLDLWKEQWAPDLHLHCCQCSPASAFCVDCSPSLPRAHAVSRRAFTIVLPESCFASQQVA